MTPQQNSLYFSQAGMAATLRRFTEYQNQMQGTINQTMGISSYSCDFAAKTAVFAFPVREWMQNPSGVMHGGSIAAAVDMAMGSCTCYWAGCKITPTISMQLNYLRPIPVGQCLLLQVTVQSCGRTTAYATLSGYLEGREEKPVVTGSGVYHVPGDEGFLQEVYATALADLAGANSEAEAKR